MWRWIVVLFIRQQMGPYYEYAKGSTLTASNKDSFWKLFGLTEEDFQ